MVFFGAIVVTFYPHRKDDVLKEIFRNLVYLLVVLAVFGIIADAAHILALVAAKLWSWLRPLWILLFFLSGALEDGGEMLVVSVTLWYVFLLHGRLTTKVTANDTV